MYINIQKLKDQLWSDDLIKRLILIVDHKNYLEQTKEINKEIQQIQDINNDIQENIIKLDSLDYEKNNKKTSLNLIKDLEIIVEKINPQNIQNIINETIAGNKTLREFDLLKNDFKVLKDLTDNHYPEFNLIISKMDGIKIPDNQFQNFKYEKLNSNNNQREILKPSIELLPRNDIDDMNFLEKSVLSLDKKSIKSIPEFENIFKEANVINLNTTNSDIKELSNAVEKFTAVGIGHYIYDVKNDIINNLSNTSSHKEIEIERKRLEDLKFENKPNIINYFSVLGLLTQVIKDNKFSQKEIKDSTSQNKFLEEQDRESNNKKTQEEKYNNLFENNKLAGMAAIYYGLQGGCLANMFKDSNILRSLYDKIGNGSLIGDMKLETIIDLKDQRIKDLKDGVVEANLGDDLLSIGIIGKLVEAINDIESMSSEEKTKYNKKFQKINEDPNLDEDEILKRTIKYIKKNDELKNKLSKEDWKMTQRIDESLNDQLEEKMDIISYINQITQDKIDKEKSIENTNITINSEEVDVSEFLETNR